ncbi:peptidoglycan DD-metalloendopeptidase family protein [Streptomyces sp. NPDC001292]|uniref:peptidoglycan DD-metalloendopeptidase family protein n=1 Tax=Streptomyces sp. NPDC001292 TaxID=3364558 RepID=UPI00369B69E1
MFRRSDPRVCRSRVAGVLLLAAAALSPAFPAVAADGSGTRSETAAVASADPKAAVTERLRARAEKAMGAAAAREDRPIVRVVRKSGRWAFGTAVMATEKGSERMPQGWLFVAERQDGEWRAALEGEERFADISRRSPVVGAREKALFAQQDGKQRDALEKGDVRGPADVRKTRNLSKPSGETESEGEVGLLSAGGDYRTGMALPTTIGANTVLTSGPHGWGGYESPWSSIDLAGGDEVVRAARQGNAYTMCTGWIRVIHDRGYATDYYHLWSNINTNGGWVNTGDYLGYTGTDVTCGGAAYGRHVHFALRQDGAYIGIAGHGIGKWVLYNGGAAYQGGALHGSYWVGAGGTLYNYGVLGFNQGIVDANGGGSVNRRSGPGTGYGIAGSVADGATVTVSCSANGTSHTGRYGTTSLWNKLSDGTWISDAYMWSGVNGPINGWC